MDEARFFGCDEHFMRLALREAERAAARGDRPAFVAPAGDTRSPRLPRAGAPSSEPDTDRPRPGSAAEAAAGARRAPPRNARGSRAEIPPQRPRRRASPP